MTNEQKPSQSGAVACHFCKSTATGAAFLRISDDFQGWQVECSTCGAMGPMNKSTEAEAIAERNKLAHPSHAPASDEVVLWTPCIDPHHQWKCDGKWHTGWNGHDPYCDPCASPKPAASDEAIVEVVKAAIHLTDAALAAAAPMIRAQREEPAK